MVSGEGGVSTAVVGELASVADFSTAAGAGGGGSVALELCVLLIDPISRKFELLQFQFDSSRARVSDLLAQLRDTLTEKAVKDQRYVGVTDSTGTVREGAVRLLEAYGGRHAADGKRGDGRCSRMVLVAKPMGVSIRETMRLARPVLTDPEVVAMVSRRERERDNIARVCVCVGQCVCVCVACGPPRVRPPLACLEWNLTPHPFSPPLPFVLYFRCTLLLCQIAFGIIICSAHCQRL